MTKDFNLGGENKSVKLFEGKMHLFYILSMTQVNNKARTTRRKRDEMQKNKMITFFIIRNSFHAYNRNSLLLRLLTQQKREETSEQSFIHKDIFSCIKNEQGGRKVGK